MRTFEETTSYLKKAKELVARINAKYDAVYAKYSTVSGAQPKTPEICPDFDTVDEALKYASSREEDINRLLGKIEAIESEDIPKLEEIQNIADRLDVKSSPTRSTSARSLRL